MIGTTLIGRGDYTISDIRGYVEKLQAKGCFTGWSRKAVKVGLCDIPPHNQSSAMLALFNTTAISKFFSHVYRLFDKIYKKQVSCKQNQQFLSSLRTSEYDVIILSVSIGLCDLLTSFFDNFWQVTSKACSFQPKYLRKSGEEVKMWRRNSDYVNYYVSLTRNDGISTSKLRLYHAVTLGSFFRPTFITT